MSRCVENGEEYDISTQFLRTQLINLKQHLERYVNVLPVFGFNSGSYYLNLIKSYLIQYLICDEEIEPTVIKKANDLKSFKFVDVQLFGIIKILGGATTLGSFLKHYKASETTGFFYEWFDRRGKLDCTELSPFKPFSVNWEKTTL